jgi:hypothetical protein
MAELHMTVRASGLAAVVDRPGQRGPGELAHCAGHAVWLRAKVQAADPDELATTAAPWVDLVWAGTGPVATAARRRMRWASNCHLS